MTDGVGIIIVCTNYSSNTLELVWGERSGTISVIFRL